MSFKQLVITFALSILACGTAPAADTVYTNARIYTVDDANPWAEAVAIEDGRFVVVGTAGDVEPVIGEQTEVIDLNGAFVMPGIQENHVHASSAGATILKYANRATFTPDNSPEEIRQILVEYAEANPGDGWIWGQQWGNGHFPDGRARKDLLDDLFPTAPCISSTSRPTMPSSTPRLWNSRVSPPRRRSRRRASSRRTRRPASPPDFWPRWACSPSGGLQAHPAVDTWKQAIVDAQEILLAFGITAITDMAVSREANAAWKALADEGRIRMRVDTALIMNDYFGEEADPSGSVEAVAGVPVATPRSDVGEVGGRRNAPHGHVDHARALRERPRKLRHLDGQRGHEAADGREHARWLPDAGPCDRRRHREDGDRPRRTGTRGLSGVHQPGADRASPMDSPG